MIFLFEFSTIRAAPGTSSARADRFRSLFTILRPDTLVLTENIGRRATRCGGRGHRDGRGSRGRRLESAAVETHLFLRRLRRSTTKV